MAFRRAYENYDGGFSGRVHEMRKAQLSWSDCAIQLEKETGMAVNRRALRSWFENSEWAKEPTSWWQSPAVRERAERRAMER
jgi:hypothetical protein